VKKLGQTDKQNTEESMLWRTTNTVITINVACNVRSAMLLATLRRQICINYLPPGINKATS